MFLSFSAWSSTYFRWQTNRFKYLSRAVSKENNNTHYSDDERLQTSQCSVKRKIMLSFEKKNSLGQDEVWKLPTR